MQDKFSIDSRLFDRLVDGELSPAERRSLLASLDNKPDGWKRCALSFLEAQSWREDFGQLVQEGSQTRRRKAAVSLSNVTDISSDRATLHRRLSWLAIAASLFVAFTLGSIASRDGGVPLANNNAAAPGIHAGEVVPPPAATLADAAKVDDALTLWVRDDAGQTRPLRVPLVDAADLEQQLGLQFQSGVPPAVRNRLENRGFDVRSRQRVAPLWLENGRPMFVPVEDTKIVPVSQNVY